MIIQKSFRHSSTPGFLLKTPPHGRVLHLIPEVLGHCNHRTIARCFCNQQVKATISVGTSHIFRFHLSNGLLEFLQQVSGHSLGSQFCVVALQFKASLNQFRRTWSSSRLATWEWSLFRTVRNHEDTSPYAHLNQTG